LKRRLIVFATDLGPLIAGIDVCDQQTRSARGADKPEQHFQNFTLGEFISGSSLSPATVLFFML
jgi:hypothetical protein